MNDSALSIVQIDNFDTYCPKTIKNTKKYLLVRARIKGDIEAVFPNVKVIVTSKKDYRFRSYIKRVEVEAAISDRLKNIDYENFKNSVPESNPNIRHDAYNRIWAVLYGVQYELYEKDTKFDWTNYWNNKKVVSQNGDYKPMFYAGNGSFVYPDTSTTSPRELKYEEDDDNY
jgi:hypothetical protein